MTPAPGRPYCGFWRRLAAAGLDLAALSAALAPLLYAAYGTDYFSWKLVEGSPFASYGAWDLLATRLLPLALLVVFWSGMGATPGKLLMGCEVLVASTGRRPGPARAALRALAYLISALPLYLGFLWMAWDKRKQGFHDKIAGTVVCQREDDESRKSLARLVQELR